MSELLGIEERNSAFQNRLRTLCIVNKGHKDLRAFLEDSYKIFLSEVEPAIHEHAVIKVSTCFGAIFEKVTISLDGEKKEQEKLYIHSSVQTLDIESSVGEFYRDTVTDFVLQKVENIQLRGSGFRLSEIKELTIQINSYDPFGGSSYIELPKFLKNKKAIINVKNNDNQCFKYAIWSALSHASEETEQSRKIKNAERVSKYENCEHEHELNFTGINFPVELKSITKFEELNPSISINVYMFDEKRKLVQPVRLTRELKIKHIHLLLLGEPQNEADEIDLFDYNDDDYYNYEDHDEDMYEVGTIQSKNDITSQRNMHYCWIKNLSALLSHRSTNRKKKIFCDRCLNHFTEKSILEAHQLVCLNQNEYRIEMPTTEDNLIQFENYSKQMRVPFVIYADVESILKKPDVQFCRTETTKAYQQHEVFSIGYYLKCSYDNSKSFYRSMRSLDCIDWFVKELQSIAFEVEEIYENIIPMKKLTSFETMNFQSAETCHICGNMLGKDRVLDHCHFTGEYRGAAHTNCNLQLKKPRFIPVVFHNLAKYDAHFIIKTLATKIPGMVQVIPRNEELYVSFTKTIPSSRDKNFSNHMKLRFIDSFQFMTSSLDYLSSLLPLDKKENLRSENKGLSYDKLKLLERKGIFCYEFVDAWSKLDETRLPTKEQFYSSLYESHISDEDYAFAQKVWNEFQIKTLGEYSDLYMKTDILLLADVFENLRDTCFDNYKLDPAQYYTSPGLSFDAMLKYTKTKIELLTQVDMLLFCERGVRGGISQCSKRYAKANNKYMDDYNDEDESKYLMYLDANNLYGYSMMQHLPIGNYKWCNKVFTVDDIMRIPDDCSYGYIFEVDLDYPQYLHDKHKDYPFLAENCKVPHSKNDMKLLLTLFDKKNYVVHYKMLKCSLQQGLVLRKIHRVLEFEQSQWLKPYIDLNTSLRTRASNEFEKNFYKLLINAIYGKTMENVRSRVDIKLRTNWNGRWGVRKLIAMPNFKRCTIFDENLIAVHMNKTSVLMNKPITVGMAILDISKVLMYDFYYNFMQKKYGPNVEMVYTDTDSFIMEIKTDCFYTDMLSHLDKFDTSDYPMDNQFQIPLVNKKIPGLFKDELNGEILTEFVGLRSKMYCVRADRIEKMKKAKGVKNYVLKKTITFQDYLDCILKNCNIIRSQNSFRSKNHKVFTVKQSKTALSPFDNKRFILNDNIETLPWGHYKI